MSMTLFPEGKKIQPAGSTRKKLAKSAQKLRFDVTFGATSVAPGG
jgi:hypothetical protein